jgi:hypothetical protein
VEIVMRKSLILLAGILSTGLALPAMADIHELGAVNVAADTYTHVSWSRFDGPVMRLRFIAANDTVDCEHIVVTYRDGTVHNVFSGVLRKDSMETITFPEGDSRIRDVNFACKSASLDGARILLSAVSQNPWGPDDVTLPAHVQTHAVTEPR